MIYVLVLISHVNSGSVVSFQEFNNLVQCNYVKEWTVQKAEYIGSRATGNCFEKGLLK